MSKGAFKKRKMSAAEEEPVLRLSAASNFFASRKEKGKVEPVWRVEGTLLIGSFRKDARPALDPAAPVKLAAFDLDGTLIKTSSGKQHAQSETDWKFFDANVKPRIIQLASQGYHIVIFSNQNGIVIGDKKKRYEWFKQKLHGIMATLGVPIICYAATGKDIFRKPCIGMFEHFMKHQVLDHTLNKNESFFVGDAAGRIAQGKTATDFSCSDRKFAHNAGLPFHTPEAFFLNEVERSFAWTKDGAFDAPSYITTAETPGIPGLSEQELVLMVAPPAAGKTTFFQRHFAPLGYIRINQDKLGTRDRCIKVAKEALQQGQRIVVDNTSPAIATRAEWIVLCRSLNVKIRCIELQTPIAIARHNNAYRALTQPVQDLEKRTLLPDTAFIRFTSAYQEPTVEEGFVEVLKVPFVPDAERPEWRRFFF